LIKDAYGRPVISMRISVTPACNFDCLYCHNEGIRDSNGDEMTPSEIRRIVEVGAGFGVRKVKITGGEPLLRDDAEEIVSEVAGVPGIEDVSMTTNAYYLKDRAHDLKKAGLDRVNVSLDTLRSETFSWITQGGELDRVLEGVDAAIRADLKPVKVNMVVMRGVNEDEVKEFLSHYSSEGVILQLIELMASDKDFFDRYYTALDALEKGFERDAMDVRERRYMQGRKQYRLNGSSVEVVRPMHNTRFCARCTRVRVTSDGRLKPCLMRSDNLIDILTPLRDGADTATLETIFKEAVEKREPFFKPS
jgi:cyclic pyranopterin phosphate synthase